MNTVTLSVSSRSDVKAVHADVRALIEAGVVDQDTRGVEFPFDGVHVDFTLTAAA